MGKITYNLYLHPRKKANGLFPLFVRRTENRKHKYVEELIELKFDKRSKKNSEWDKKSKEVINRSDADDLNDLFKVKLKEYKRPHHDGSHSAHSSKTVLEFMEELITLKKNSFAFSTATKYQTIYFHLKRFMGTEDLRFSAICVAWIERFRTYLYQNIDCRGDKPSNNTLNNILSGMSTVVDKALNDDKLKKELNGINPFKNCNQKLIPPRKPSTRMALTGEELYMLYHVDAKDARINSYTFDALNIFMFQFASKGMRIGDALLLKWKNLQPDKIFYTDEKGENPKQVDYFTKNVFALRWCLNYNPDELLWDWVNKCFFWEKECEDYRYETPLLTADREYYEALQDVNDEYERLLSDLPLRKRAELTEYELFNLIKKKIPSGVTAQLKKAEEKRMRETLHYIFRYIQSTDKKNDYIFPYMRSLNTDDPEKVFSYKKTKTAVVNKALKKLAKQLNMRNFSSHINRHSLATTLADNNEGIHIIREAFDHSGYNVTENYMQGFNANIKPAMERVFAGLGF